MLNLTSRFSNQTKILYIKTEKNKTIIIIPNYLINEKRKIFIINI